VEDFEQDTKSKQEADGHPGSVYSVMHALQKEHCLTSYHSDAVSKVRPIRKCPVTQRMSINVNFVLILVSERLTHKKIKNSTGTNCEMKQQRNNNSFIVLSLLQRV